MNCWAIFRLLEHLDVPCRALIGPWGHRYPHMGVPGPAIGFLQEILRWFDRWLKGQDNSAERDSGLFVWMQESVPPSTSYEDRPGRWILEPSWPSPSITQRRYSLGYRSLLDGNAASPLLEERLASPLSVGLYAGKWCSYAALPDLPHDQREEDGGCLIFDSNRLEEDMEILGMPEVELEVAADKPVAQVAVRLSDVLPDGRATRLTYGVLNLTHRDGSEDPTPLETGRFYHVRVRMNGLASRIPSGHKLRLSISSTYFPLIWAPPEPVNLTLRVSDCRLILPERCRREDIPPCEFGEAEGAPRLAIQLIAPPEHSWRVVRDMVDDVATLEVINDEGSYRLSEIDLEISRRTTESYSFRGADFASLRGMTATERAFRRGDWSTRTVTKTVLTSDAENFNIHARLDAYEGERRIYSENWDETIPRDLI